MQQKLLKLNRIRKILHFYLHFGNDNYYPIIDGEKSQSELGYIEHILNLLGLDEEMEYILELKLDGLDRKSVV